MASETIPCARCKYALNLIKQKGLSGLAGLLQQLAELVAHTEGLSDLQRQSLNVVLMFLIQNLGYGSTLPRSVVLKIVGTLRHDAPQSSELFALCDLAERQFAAEYHL